MNPKTGKTRGSRPMPADSVRAETVRPGRGRAENLWIGVAGSTG